jgi:hypothetical protein
VDAAAGGAEGGLAVGAILVTTVVDELDANATPTSPGPPGLSLREAVAYAKAQAGADVIGFEALSGPVLLSSGLAIDDQDALVISGGGQAVDCSAIGNAQACVTVSANDVTIESLELDACPGKALLVDSTTSFRLESSTIQGCDGVQINSNVGSAVVRGNRVDSSSGDCFTVQAAAEMLDNEISNCGGVAIKVSSTVAAVGTVVRGNLIYLTDTGVLLGLNSDDSVVDHNTIGDASIDAINLAASVAGVFVRNNALVSSQHGLNGSDGQFAARSNNLYWSNSAADCSGCTVDASSLLSDPLFENEAARDYRPQPLSPLVDAGVDTGADRNGSAAGNFNGTAPDIGYYEL